MFITQDRFNVDTMVLFFVPVLVLAGIAIVYAPIESVLLINGLHHPWLDVLFSGITLMGDGTFVVLAAIVLLLYRVYNSIAMLANGVVQGLIVSLFKRVLFPRTLRPAAFLEGQSVHLVPGVALHQVYSFPSGHTVTIFGLCVFLALCSSNRFVTVLLLILSVLVGLSRVYLLQHFVGDVAAGALIGNVVGIAAYYGVAYMRKPEWMMRWIIIRWGSAGRELSVREQDGFTSFK
ncbi:phosphatase PAP2 family protein [Parachryseolinea silvisoli]|uniref:phosphatase PAP2 family protein n=1 Tax=Parachryseolinea silvisoli TaxID=2873601 RepID=UPI002265ACCC|nr:phosphatase PAP2 family protein [Parachryseolinea silvisoli]MCD9019274.1 phosphatase PAP2 family protein [Parachryseolinea silvisoli]